MPALGHRRGQEFGPLVTLTPHSYSFFFCVCEAALLYFFCLLQLRAILRPLCFLAVGRGRSSSGQDGLSWWGNASPQTYVFLQITSPALFCERVQPFSSTFNLFFFFFFFPPSPPHFSPRVQSISSAFLFFSASPGWETGHSCRGTASLSRVALSRPPPKHTATSYPGNRLSFLYFGGNGSSAPPLASILQ